MTDVVLHTLLFSARFADPSRTIMLYHLHIDKHDENRFFHLIIVIATNIGRLFFMCNYNIIIFTAKLIA